MAISAIRASLDTSFSLYVLTKKDSGGRARHRGSQSAVTGPRENSVPTSALSQTDFISRLSIFDGVCCSHIFMATRVWGACVCSQVGKPCICTLFAPRSALNTVLREGMKGGQRDRRRCMYSFQSVPIGNVCTTQTSGSAYTAPSPSVPCPSFPLLPNA